MFICACIKLLDYNFSCHYRAYGMRDGHCSLITAVRWSTVLYLLSKVDSFFKTISDKSILTHSRIIVYTVEGSAINIPFLNVTSLDITVYLNEKKIYSDAYFGSIKTKKHDVVLHTDFQMKNVTQSDTGYYWLDIPSENFAEDMLELSITSKCIVNCQLMGS